MKRIIENSLAAARESLDQFIKYPKNLDLIEEAGRIMANALKAGHKIISCGNGGSLCDATHFAEELTGRYRHNRVPLPAIAINDPAYLTCVGNDFGFEEVFSRYVMAVGNPGDVLLAITTSGYSSNILKAISAAGQKGLKIIMLTSGRPEHLQEMKNSNLTILSAPASDYSDRVQEIHIKIIHILIELIETHLVVGVEPGSDPVSGKGVSA